MGYNYYIVLDEKENENWKEIYRYSNSGSFSCESNHYFLMERHSGYNLGKDEEEYSWYVFTPEQVLDEYNKYDRGDWKLRMKRIIDSSETQEEAIKAIEELKYDDQFYFPSYWEELEKWAELILKNQGKQLRIKYGIAV
jgi:hypothetical protein